MSDKAVKKKQYILDTAKKVFAEKGFKDVTMKDIVEACDISRGGLYIYFDSTEGIFKELLQELTTQAPDAFSKNLDKDYSAGDLLALFLKEQKKEILNEKDNLSVAMYEYMFHTYKAGSGEECVKNAFNESVKIIAKLIDEGVESGEFYCEDAEGAARNIMYVIEGLKIAANTVGIKEKDIDRELLYIVGGLIVEE